jgi:chemotaxis protein methyltransferase CheR
MELALYNKLKKKIEEVLGINLDAYKDEQMRRRLDSWLVRSGAKTWEEYFVRVKSEPTEFEKFRNYLTINVTEFFRDSEKWKYLREKVLPDLLKETNSLRPFGTGLRIWSAGCSIGAEPYSLAMMIDELAHARKHYLLASDLDRGALAKARAGGPYSEDEIKNLAKEQRSRYLKAGGPPYHIDPKIIKLITFKEHNLLADPYENDMDMIVCRNVIIYFTTEAKDYIFKHFHSALRPGGILYIGGTEIIPKPQEIGFVTSGISFYKKVS